MVFHWLFCIKYQQFLSTCGAFSEAAVCEVECRATYFGSLGAKRIFVPLGVSNEFDP